ncbi:conserved hypothetical protein [Talaromyces stipitatus ATCC 10500]|uniref:Integral membrane protein n=1 Tax=Talaromyces stipitatus (strain ATCC 10500 / CBS 375.48 / QM 6759 / NRRL 1006) TaxID=441959 RepID=B8M8R8_TALSN|nr:uncharacterized protein TSTA_037950 [Talaromyces stipitatus ATCC 10500]EED20581.1 conserved hypothetical protein [Talaromyces stipitatus ATCC 10500]
MIFTLNTISKVFALVSFTLSTLCLFAGSQKSILQNASVVLLDTSASEPTSAIQAAANRTAADLGLKDFYAIHVLTYCEGNFKSSVEGGLEVTSCSKRRAPFAFDPAKVFSAGFKAGFNISDINWPDSITDDFEVMEMTTKAMSVLYVIGVASTGVVFLMEILLTQAGGKPSMFAHLFFVVLSFVCLGVSSSVASGIAVQFVNLINRHGQGFGVVAKGGSSFLGMTWSAVVLSFLTVVISVITLPSSGGTPISEKEIEDV